MSNFSGAADYAKAWGTLARTAASRVRSSMRRKPEPRGRRMVVRSFDAANQTRLEADWGTGIDDINCALAKELGVLVGRSRNEFRNDDYARSFIYLVKNNMVGDKGVTVQARSKDANGTLDQEANATIEAAHMDWSMGKHCDVSGRYTWPEMQRLWAATAAKDGDSIMMKHHTGKYGFALQFVDAAYLDHTLNEPFRDGRRIVCGVETDMFNRPLAYYFKSGSAGSRHQRFTADVIMHAFVSEDVNQVRGYPWMSTSMPRMNMLKGFEDAALAASRSGACNVTYIETPTGTEYVGDGVNSDGTIAIDTEPGSVNQVAAGTTIHDTNPAYPHQSYDVQIDKELQGIAAGLGPSISGLTKDVSKANYSSMRSGKLDEQAFWKPLQNWMISNLNAPVYADWIESAIAIGAIKFPHGAPLALNKLDKFSAVEFQPNRWPWVDPSKDIKAKIDGVRENMTTVSQVIREQGGDPEAVFLERAAELERMRELNITFIPETTAEGIAVVQPVVQPEVDKDSEDGDDETED